MKKIVLTALAAMPITAFAQGSQFNLKAQIGTENKSAMAYLSYRLAGKAVLNSAIVTDGASRFNGAITSTVKAQVVLNYGGVGIKKLGRGADALTMYLEKGNIVLTPKASVKNAVITDSKINTENVAYTKSISVPEQIMAAIKADGLDWTQVSDLKFWNNDVVKQYRIHSIPQNFLIDPSGKIVSKNLRGEALNQN